MSSETIEKSFGTDYEVIPKTGENKNRPDAKTIFKHLGLFVLTFISVSYVSTYLVGIDPGSIVLGGFSLPFPSATDLGRGGLFATLLLSFLTVHEFGHYIAAVLHKIKVTLPYFIPLPLGIGTLGAVIRIKERIIHTRQLFDIGAAGPLAGFAVSVIILIIGFSTLPDPSFVQNLAGHEELKAYVAEYRTFPDYITDSNRMGVLTVGNTLLYSFLASFFDNVPPMWEMYHYPFLFAGWLGLFFTALNLMPVGQLDGGHILYSLIGYKKHRIAARIFFTFITLLAGIETVPFLHQLLISFDSSIGTLAWLVWTAVLFLLFNHAFKTELVWVFSSLVISLAGSATYIYLIAGPQKYEPSLIWLFWSFFITFLIKIEHPPVLIEKPLSTERKVLGWLSMLIFVLCISFNPLSFK